MSGFAELAAQSVVWLALVAVIGVIVGWSFGSLRASRTTGERYDTQLRATMRRMSDAESEVVTLRAKLEQYEVNLSSQARESESREHLLEALEARLAEAEDAAQDARRASESADETLAPASNGVPPSSIEDVVARTSANGAVPVDDLTRIKGIGKVIQKTLNELGITSYAQIARLTDDDVVIVEDALDSFRGRIQRDDWMGSAAALYDEVYGG